MTAGTAPTRLVFLADTHVPRRARTLPEPVWRAVDAADAVVHAGDWTAAALLDELRSRARRLLAVAGNNDGPELGLPAAVQEDVSGLQLAVLHDSGPAQRREERLAARFPGADVVVFGHSHIRWDSIGPGGVRLLNPGSPTDRRREPFPTFLTAAVRAGRLSAVTCHRLAVLRAG